MQFKSLIQQDCTKSAVLFHSKKRILEFISEVAHQQLPEVSEQDILTALQNREKLGSTGIGQGIAIPHGKLLNIHKTVVVFVVNQDAIAFDAIDSQPVDIFCAMLIPEDQCQQHLGALKAVAKMLSDKNICKRIRATSSDEELFQVITEGAD